MKRWELAELKRFAREFMREFYSEAYEEATNNRYLKPGELDDSGSNIAITEHKGYVLISLVSSSNWKRFRKVSISDLVSADSGWKFYLKEMIQFLNDYSIVPDDIEINCTGGIMRDLIIDGKEYFKLEEW